MTVSRGRRYSFRIFAAGELTGVFRKILAEMFPREYDADVSIFRTLPDKTEQSLHKKSLEDLSDFCDANSQGSIMVEFGKPLGSYGVAREVWLHFSGDDSGFDVSVGAILPDQLSVFIKLFESYLGLSELDDESEVGDFDSSEEFRQLEERVAALEARSTDRSDLKCFLSYQFSEPSFQYAKSVRNLLELVGVKVITGEGYEPRQVQAKVSERLHSGVDIVVLIEVQGKKSAWTRDEIALAQTPGVFLIPIVENGAEFDRGIFGDHEYIKFESGHIGDAFVQLLEGIYYVRSTKSTDPSVRTAAAG